MQIFFYYSASVEITFDDIFKIYVTDNIDNILDKIRWAFSEYNFTHADVTDGNTGELILTARS